MRLAYVAGPYRDPRGEWWVLQNIREAETVALALWRMEFAVLCPHKNTALFGGACGPSENIWLQGDLEMMRRCDLVVMLPTWERSSGARAEREMAFEWEIPVFYWPVDEHKLRVLASEDATANTQPRA